MILMKRSNYNCYLTTVLFRNVHISEHCVGQYIVSNVRKYYHMYDPNIWSYVRNILERYTIIIWSEHMILDHNYVPKCTISEHMIIISKNTLSEQIIIWSKMYIWSYMMIIIGSSPYDHHHMIIIGSSYNDDHMMIIIIGWKLYDDYHMIICTL